MVFSSFGGSGIAFFSAAIIFHLPNYVAAEKKNPSPLYLYFGVFWIVTAIICLIVQFVTREDEENDEELEGLETELNKSAMTIL